MNQTNQTFGFIGVGVMGEPMCRNLRRKTGARVIALDRDPAPLDRLAAEGVTPAKSIAEAVASSDVVFLSLPSGEAVEQVVRAPDGLKFYTGKMFPAAYRGRIFIAEHGSWNRSKKSGYRVVSVTLKDNKVESSEVFAEGWMENEQVWGRPVGLLVMPDGSLLISDDTADAVYRVSYRG